MIKVLIILFFLSGFSFALCESGWEIVEDGKAICVKIVEEGDGYYREEERFSLEVPVIQGKRMDNTYELFKATVGARVGGKSACGLNVFANYLYGLKHSIKALERFINDWMESATAVALYALATYLPVAKEVLMGAEMLSNAVAQLQGFSCERAMQLIKQMNYTDSVLVKNCIINRLGIDESDYDSLMQTDPDRWWEAYNECLNEGSLFDAVPANVRKWFEEKLNYKGNLYCAFWGNTPWREVIRNLPDRWSFGGLKERAKILAFAVTPSFKFTARANDNRLAKIELGGVILDGETRSVRELIDRMFYNELPQDVGRVVHSVFIGYAVCARYGMESAECSDAMDVVSEEIANFEKKWNVDLEPILNGMDFLAKVSYLLSLQAENGDPEAGKLLAELIVTFQSTYGKEIQKKVYLEVKKQLIEQFDSAIAYLRAQKSLGKSARCPAQDEALSEEEDDEDDNDLTGGVDV